MIKINLLPASEQKKRARSGGGGGGGGSQLFGVILILVLVAEAVGLYIWYSGVEDEARKANLAHSTVVKKLDKLKRAKVEFEKREKERDKLNKQNLIFSNLDVGRTGPLEALQFLAYVLTPTDPQQTDELEAHEEAGWSSSWNPDTVWLKEIKQTDDGWVALNGVARTTQDAAEFLRRLESSIYFVLPDMPKLEPETDEVFPDRLTLTAFEIQAVLNLNKAGEFRMYKEDMPDALRAFLKKPKKKAAPKKGNKKKPAKKKGKKA